MYYKVMYWTLTSYLHTFISTLSGYTKVDERGDQEYGFFESIFKKVAGIVLKLGEGIPVVGTLVEYVEGII